MLDGRRVDYSQGDAKKQRKKIIERIVAFIASLITIGLFIYGFFFSSSDEKKGGQSTNIQTGSNSPVGVIQTETGDVNVYLTANGEVSQGIDPLEGLDEMSCPDRLAKSYDLVYKARETGQYDEAIAVITAMTKLEGTDLQSMSILQYNLGLMLYESGDVGTAQNVFRKVVRGGGFPDAFYSLGVVSVKIEDEKTNPDYQEAIDAFTYAIEGAQVREYYLARAWAYEKSGCGELAEADKKTAESL